jgi:ferredoxin
LQIEESPSLATAQPVSPADTRGIPVALVSYVSHGNVLVVAGDAAARAHAAAKDLARSLHVTLLHAGVPASDGGVTTWSGRIVSATGHLGAFDATFADLAVDKGKPATRETHARFDLILDFSPQPIFTRRLPPQGYFRAPDDDASLERVLEEMREAVGEFEKPRYFSYRENVCAHQRSEIVGCSACIDICSAEAIRADGDHVKVDPHLCMGCGACSTVCPSGAMSYQFPPAADRGDDIKRRLGKYREAGGRDACVVFHDGRGLVAGTQLPARAIAIEVWHVASIGLDLALSAVAFGAAQVAVVARPSDDREYLAAMREQFAIGGAILEALGYEGARLQVIEAQEPADVVRALAGEAPASVAQPAAFMVSNDKRTAIEFAVEHLLRHAPRRVDEIALPQGAPFGEIQVDQAKCTMCMSCVGACPVSALMDGVDQPLLKFVERNCVQCGLCEETCPEEAIALNPRLLLTPAVREARVLNQTQPFHCVSCGKAFGTKQMVDTMLGRLAGHSMFSRPEALRRLQMCGDCRVVDMMNTKDEVTVFSLGDRS